MTDVVRKITISATGEGIEPTRGSTEKLSVAITQLTEANRKNSDSLRDAITDHESYADKVLKVATGLAALVVGVTAAKSAYSSLSEIMANYANTVERVAVAEANLLVSVLPDSIRAYTVSWADTNKQLASYIELAGRAGALGVSTTFYQNQIQVANSLKITNDSIIKQMQTLNGVTGEQLGGSTGQQRVDQLTSFGNFKGNTGVDQLATATTQEEEYKAVVSLIDQAMAKGERLAALDVAKTFLGSDAAANLGKDAEYLDRMQSAADKLAGKNIISDVDVGRALDLSNRLIVAEDIIGKKWFASQQMLNPLVMFFKGLWVDIVETVASAFTWVEKITKSLLSVPSSLWATFQNWRHAGEAEGPQQETPDQAYARAQAQLRVGMQNPNAVTQSTVQTNSLSIQLRRDTSKSGLPDAETKDAFDRAEESLRKYIETTNAASLSIDATAGAQERLKAVALLTAAGMKDGLSRATATARAQLNGLTTDAGYAAEALAKARVASQIKFGQNTAFLSPEDVSIATQLKHVYPDVATALGSVEAAGLRTNAALSGISGQLSGQLTTGLTDILDGTKSVGAGFTDMSKVIIRAIEEMIVKLLIVGPLMRALQGGLGGLLGGGSSNATDGIGGFGPTVPGHASGTNASPGGWHWVGENGPELMNLPRGAKVLPNGQTPGGGGVTAPVQIKIDATGADEAGLARVAAQLARLQAELPSTIVKTVQKAKTNRVL